MGLKTALTMVFSAPEQNPYSMANVSNAATTVTLAATDLGLGSCYVVTPTLALGKEPELAKKIGVPGGMKPMCCVLVGYPESDAFATPRKKSDSNVNYCR
ncbi:nitroreductase family protein [Desulfosarcina sp. OttesenSCG-928-B08]|nr:nitroreductase family protein [Desulfosarcina sp. OttesenSCG-928-B08]